LDEILECWLQSLVIGLLISMTVTREWWQIVQILMERSQLLAFSRAEKTVIAYLDKPFG